jgi:pyruvyltransferase
MMNSIPLFWWSEIRLMSKKKENYGDLLSKYLVEKLSEKKVEWVQPKKMSWFKLNKINYLAAGSIIHHANKKSIVWGSGIIDEKQKIAKADFQAVRGPRTRNYLLDLGYACPEVYGDPAVLLPLIYKPNIDKVYRIGVIPHYNDYNSVYEIYKNANGVRVIDLMTLDIEKVTNEILKCEKVVSSSLHGIIVAHAYRIPAVWIEFSNKIFGNGIKYMDYLESVKLPTYKPNFVGDNLMESELIELVENGANLPTENIIKKLQEDLMVNCPFI